MWQINGKTPSSAKMAILRTNNAGKTSKLHLVFQKIALKYSTKDQIGLEFPKNILEGPGRSRVPSEVILTARFRQPKFNYEIG